MKTPERWLEELVENPLFPVVDGPAERETLLDAIRRIQNDAVSSLPQLEELSLSDADLSHYDEHLSEMFDKPAGRDLINNGSAAIMGSKLLHDLRQCRRLLEDCYADGSLERTREVRKDGYREGWNARVVKGAWTTLGSLSLGDVCETEEGKVVLVGNSPLPDLDFCSTRACRELNAEIHDSHVWSYVLSDSRVRKLTVNWEVAK